ncbi:MAG: hypothetical protein P8M22_00960 [Phycisphaerales bacterium]|nr:hypothetical protein [Phycisphaerales bacterium]
MSRKVHIKAPAKINAALSVGPPLADGMHPISSWMITVDLYDEIELTALDAGSLSRYAILWHEEASQTPDIDWPIASDLAVRAHLALEKHLDRPLPLQMKLEKRIPLGGGLGGGSSDAAAMLRGINALYELDLADDVLEAIAAEIGSDLPFLVRGGSGIVEGCGEQVEHLDELSQLDAVLVLPGLACDTGQVYKSLDTAGAPGVDSDRVRSLASSMIDGGALFNDLAEPAMCVAPDLRAHQHAVAELVDRPVHVSGSGSTLFVICQNSMESEAMASAIESKIGLAAVPVSAAGREAGMVVTSPAN